jgi:excinuclease ABC subunit A
VLVVEHDEATIRAADHVIDLGPGAGEQGGHVVVAGTLDDVAACAQSITGQYLSGAREIPLPRLRRPGNGRFLIIHGARENNLKNIEVRIPLGKFVCVTGVSGSGKSTLVDNILYKKAAQLIYGARDRPGECDGISGLEHIDKVVDIDQSPIGRTPRSNPATYTGAFTPIREFFASVPEARLRGYRPGRFSFNVRGGRCEACQGEGYIEIEMQFLPDVTVPCEICKGKRYNREALEVTFRGKNIAEVLDMTVDQALPFFEPFPKVRTKLQTLRDVGLGYIRLGQPATTLSGHWKDSIYTGRTDHRSVVRGRERAPAGAPPIGGYREHGGGYRAPVGRGEERRPPDRPGPAGRRPRRRDRGRRYAGGGGPGGGQFHRPVPAGPAGEAPAAGEGDGGRHRIVGAVREPPIDSMK